MLAKNIITHVNIKTIKTIHTIAISFINKNNTFEKTFHIKEGTNMLEAAHENSIELEGACEGGLACSTCHLIVADKEYYDKIPVANEQEEDMLDLAYDLTYTSRLGCQIKATKEISGIKFIIPNSTRNIMVYKLSNKK